LGKKSLTRTQLRKKGGGGGSLRGRERAKDDIKKILGTLKKRTFSAKL